MLKWFLLGAFLGVLGMLGACWRGVWKAMRGVE